jgi:uncharacterized alpha-E superfamily protein
MYRLNVRRSVSPEDVLSFLFQSTVFPRAIAHTLLQIEDSMKVLPHNKPPRKVVADLRRQLKETDCSLLADEALHDFIDELQLQLVHVHDAIEVAWFAHETA